MRKGLIFFLGVVTGCVLTIAVLFVIGITNSNTNESDITIAEQQTVFTTATKFEVFQVLGDGALANCEEKRVFNFIIYWPGRLYCDRWSKSVL